ncbi:MAG: hypothetical protein WA775_08575 [Psychroserpens sp.]|uniref:hypothetical protein n=1 Tax=Psychroserpens sp. TaxID=2020870 RepID=UPI003C94C667
MTPKFLLFLLSLSLLACKQEGSKTDNFDYKYTDKPDVLSCEQTKTALLQEALYAFEDDIVNFYTPEKPDYNRAYSLFVSEALSNKTDYSKLVSPHSQTIFEVLKNDNALWSNNKDGSHLNYNHPIFKCIGNSLKDKNFKTTFNALIDTNSMSLRMINPILRRQARGMQNDKYLATYAALELFYGKLFDAKIKSQLDEDEAYEERSGLKDQGSHEGHNH